MSRFPRSSPSNFRRFWGPGLKPHKRTEKNTGRLKLILHSLKPSKKWPWDGQRGRKSLCPGMKTGPNKIDSKDWILKYIIRSCCVTSQESSFVALKFCWSHELSRVNCSLQQECLPLSLTLIQQIFQASGFIRITELHFFGLHFNLLLVRPPYRCPAPNGTSSTLYAFEENNYSAVWQMNNFVCLTTKDKSQVLRGSPENQAELWPLPQNKHLSKQMDLIFKIDHKQTCYVLWMKWGEKKASLIKDRGVPVDISQALSQMDLASISWIFSFR